MVPRAYDQITGCIPGAMRATAITIAQALSSSGQDVRHLRSRTGKGKPDCGLVETLGTFNPIRVAFHEWVGIWRDITQPGLSARARLIYAFAPPGRSHNAGRDTSLDIKTRRLERTPEEKGTAGLS